MTEKNKIKNSNDEWGECPECGNRVKTKNLKNHLKKMHTELSKDEISRSVKIHKKNRDRQRSNRMDHRREMELERRKKNGMIAIMAIIIIFTVMIGGYLYYSYSGIETQTDNKEDLKPEPAKETPEPTEKNEIRIPLSEVNDGNAHFYSIDSNGVEIRYFILKSSDGVIRAAFDACDVCYDAKLGYKQEGDEMVCKNCGLRFDSTKINEVQGGCNPAPLDRTVDGNDVVIDISDLEKGRWYFE